MSPSSRDQRINDILTGTKRILDTTKEPLSLFPIPGLSGAVSALSALIDMVLVARGNDDTREDLAKNIKTLMLIIDETRQKAESLVGNDDDNLAHTRLVTSPELKERVVTLEKDLKDLINDANNLEKGFLGLLLSSKNASTLMRIQVGIENATRKFQIQNGITLEMLMNGIVNDIEVIKRRQQQQLDENALEKLAPVNAGYTSGLNPTTSGTLPGTRTALIEELEGWTLRSDSSQGNSFIYVISGGAGTGKSTIAFEMAHRLEKKGALGASFFFVRSADKLNTTTHVLRTIAYQLARNQKDLYPHISAAAREYTRRGKQGEQLQVDLEDLIIKPLRNVHPSHRPITLVLDAIDECTDAAQKEVVRLLYLFMQQLPKIPFPVRVLVTSRPEMHIQDALDDDDIRRISKPLKLHEIPRVTVDGDVKLFLETRLHSLKCYKDMYGARPTVIEDLTTRAAGLFIYAATIVSFLDRNQELAVEILDSLLSNSPSGAAFNLVDLDKLYVAVLRGALNKAVGIPDMESHIRFVLGGLALLQDHVPAKVLQDLVGVHANYVKYILRRLGSVIIVPENDDEEVRMLHASFPQFLTNNTRCNNPTFYIDPSIHHHRLALACLRVMTPLLKRNICELADVKIMKSDTTGLDDAVKRCISPSLQYSCVHWATHLSQVNDPSQDILDAVTNFARTKLLVWVEVLSYMDRLEVAVPALLGALSWCEANIQSRDRSEILQLIDNTHRLVLQCYTPINACPEHLYISSLRLAPSCTLTSCYNMANSNSTTIKSMTPRDLAWGARLHTIPIHSVGCRAMLSPDGSLITCGLSNGEVGIWDASIRLSMKTLVGHNKSVRCVTWAPDSQTLASGSTDGTIRVWNATSGAQIHVQHVQSRNCEVYTIAWSQDGKRLVTGAKPGGIQVWDIAVGKMLKKTTTVPETETVMIISTDARRAVDKTDKGTLRAWDIECDKGRILRELPVQFRVYAATFLHENTQVAFCGLDSAIYIWDLESGDCTPKVKLESKVTVNGKSHIVGLAVSQDGNTLASSTFNKIHFFNTKSWDSLGSFQGYFLFTASFSPENRRLLTSYNTIEMWDLSVVLSQTPQATASSSSSEIVKHDSSMHFITISPDGLRVAAVSRDAFSIWSLQSGSLTCFIQGHFVGTIAFSPDSRKIAVAAFEKTCIWDITTSEPTLVRNIPTANNSEDRITWSSDGHWIAGAAYGPSSTRGLGVFDAMTGKLVKHLTLSNKGKLWRLEFSQDSKMLYVKSDMNETIFEWKEGKQVNFKLYRWETELDRRARFHKDGWIVRERDGKRLCWVYQPYSTRLARSGNYYAVGRDSGQLDIFYMEEGYPESTTSS